MRHCQYDNPSSVIPGRLPVSLSQAGRVEAERLRDYLADCAIDHIYSSAVKRCKQTATIVAGGRVPLSYDPRLLEGLSAYQGYRWDADNEPWMHYYAHQAELGGESVGDIQSRMVDFWSTLAGDERNLVICSHGDPLYLLYAYLVDKPVEPDITRVSGIEQYIPKGGLYQFELKQGKWQFVQLITQEDM